MTAIECLVWAILVVAILVYILFVWSALRINDEDYHDDGRG